ncbi:MAG: hypothetical protein IJJ28_03600 [Lentisphaeria bacterium]|nr:hypothetical protein [Lentisphaeria bacterium]
MLIYYQVGDSLKQEVSVKAVPVEFRLSQDLMMTSETVEKLDVTVRSIPGKKKLDAQAISVIADVSSADRQADGTYKVSFKKKNVHAASGVDIVNWSPETVTLKLQRRITRDVPVAARFSGKLPEQISLSEVVSIPRNVTVSGLESVVSELKEIPTKPIPLADCERGFEYETDLALQPGISADPGRVKVRIGIENVILREFKRIPVGIFGDGEAGVRAAFAASGAAEATVALRGTERALADLTAQDLRLYVDVYNVTTPGEYQRPVNCHILRPGIEVRSIVPAEIKVSINKVQNKKP